MPTTRTAPDTRRGVARAAQLNQRLADAYAALETGGRTAREVADDMGVASTTTALDYLRRLAAAGQAVTENGCWWRAEDTTDWGHAREDAPRLKPGLDRAFG